MNRIFWSVLLSFSLLACNARADHPEQVAHAKAEKKNKKHKKSREEAPSAAVEVITRWDMPPVLKEVSGIVYLGNDRFASVQDEAGAIFIYNTGTSRIERQLNFGASGDYEGITLAGKTAYIVRSDGKIFEVDNIDLPQPKITAYTTPLTAQDDVEGLAYDKKNDRLLLALKAGKTAAKGYKEIYAFDLKTKKLLKDPVLKLNLTDPELQKHKGKNQQKAIQPSEIAINPLSGQIYITDAANTQLFIINADGSVRSRFKLSRTHFTQPEGISFSPAGELFISNEGTKGSGNILKVKINHL